MAEICVGSYGGNMGMTLVLMLWLRDLLARRVTSSLARGRSAWGRRVALDRGDVPGWVLVAVMTAGLVTALWVVADGQLTAVLDRAINSVSK